MSAALSVEESIDPFEADLPVGAQAHAVDARNWGSRKVDIRPTLVDKAKARLRSINTGSQISVSSQGIKSILSIFYWHFLVFMMELLPEFWT